MSTSTDRNDPLDHVYRQNPPWRDDHLTECGRPVGEVAGEVLTWQEYVRKHKRLGQQRSAMITCMTCHARNQYSVRVRDRETMELVDNWDENPGGVIARWMGFGGYFSTPADSSANDDFRAIAQLIERHREEFELLRQPDELGARRREAARVERLERRRRR